MPRSLDSDVDGQLPCQAAPAFVSHFAEAGLAAPNASGPPHGAVGKTLRDEA